MTICVSEKNECVTDDTTNYPECKWENTVGKSKLRPFPNKGLTMKFRGPLKYITLNGVKYLKIGIEPSGRVNLGLQPRVWSNSNAKCRLYALNTSLVILYQVPNSEAKTRKNLKKLSF